MVLVSSINWRNAGSRCPTRVWLKAARTDGATLLGPGPSNRRGGGTNIGGICMAQRIGRGDLRSNVFALTRGRSPLASVLVVLVIVLGKKTVRCRTAERN